MKTLFVCLIAGALSLASAAETHRITLFQDTTIENHAVKAGDYKLTIDNNKVVLTQGKKQVADATVKVENGDNKFNKTAARFQNADGKYRLTEIRLGGTTTKLVFDSAGTGDDR